MFNLNKMKKSIRNEQRNGFKIEKEPKSIISEAYRTLRTNIQYSSFHKEIRTIVVTSSEPLEGKSTVCGNMALAFAQDDKKVILIDCNLRNPSVHKNFKTSNLIGLSDILMERKNLEESIHKYNENLDLLPCGKIPENPSEIISLKAMKSLMEKLKEKYDMIILDSPSLKAFTDAQILSVKADGTILVVRAERTKRESVIEARSLLTKVGANIIGIVLSGANNTINKDYYYYEKVQKE